MSRTQRIVLSGVIGIPHLSGALYMPDEHVLLVADLHLEQGTSLARRGLHVPPYDTVDTLDALEAVIAETKPWRLILLGDSFHDAVAHAEIDHPSANRLRAITSGHETIWISGNHDPARPDALGGFFAESVNVGPLTLRHVPTSRLSNTFEIAGHLHPGACMSQRGIRLRAKCFVADDKRLILPAFGRYTGALNVSSSAYAGLFDATRAHVWMIGREQLHRFPLRRVL